MKTDTWKFGVAFSTVSTCQQLFRASATGLTKLVKRSRRQQPRKASDTVTCSRYATYVASSSYATILDPVISFKGE